MITYDLRKQSLTLEDVLKRAADASVQIITRDGQSFLVEPLDAFDQEVAALRQSKNFMTFLAERAQEQASIPLDDLDREINERLAQEMGGAEK
jgi:hypothetical protein